MRRVLPQVGAPRRVPSIPAQEYTTGNGLRVALVERRELPIVDLDLVFTTGAELDQPTVAGRTSLTAEMLDEGTPTRGALDIAEALDYLGADLVVQPGWDAIVVSLHVMSESLRPALDVLGDLILNASFPVEEYQRKQKERLAALLQERDEPRLVAGKALATAVFGALHPYAAPVSGTRASVTRLTRDALFALYHEQLQPRNAFLIVVGDVESGEVMRAIDERFGRWQPRALERADPLPPVPETDRRILLIDKPGAAQAELRVGHAGPPRTTPDYFALKVLNTILGGSFTSRLNTILRERMGVTYGASSRFGLRRGSGVFSTGAAVFTDAVARSAEVIVQEMQRIISQPVAQDELRRAQSYLALGLPRSFETTQDIADHLREQMLYDLPADYWSSYVDRIYDVSAGDVAQAAMRHLRPDRCAIAVVADSSKARHPLEQTGLGPVVPTRVEA